MDKQDAIDFIIQELGNNRSQEEIVSSLSKQLGAPPETVKNFVTRVLDQYQPLPPTPPKAKVSTAWETPQPETEQSNMDPNQPGEITSGQAPPSTFESTGKARHSPPQADEEIEKIILKGLSKSRRHDDLIMDICERRALNWNEAQRMVAQVQTKHRKKLTTRKNLLLIPASIIGIIVGLILVYASAADMYNLVNAGFSSQSDFATAYETGALEDTIRYAPIFFITGIVMILGSVVGLYTSLRAQFE
jgi:hypothetical protein